MRACVVRVRVGVGVVTLAEGARVRVAQRHKPLEPRDYARLLAHLTRHCLGELFA